MAISRDDVAYIAKLARLDLTPDEMAGLTKDLGEILEYVDKIAALEAVGAGRPGAPEVPSRLTPFRDDVLVASLPVEEALRPSADHDGEFFRVPPVIDRESNE